MSDIKMLSQTNLKHWEKGCKRKWRGMWIDKVVPFYSNIKMDYGKYFEYKCIGGGATDEEVTDLPRLKNGNKSTDHNRIDQQVVKFKKLYGKNSEKFMGYTIMKDQLELNGNDGISRGTIDYTTDNGLVEGKEFPWDLKLTGNVDAVRHWAHWGHSADELDVTQAVFYIDLWEQNYGYRPEFKYLVFDYSPKMGTDIVTVSATDDHINMLNERKEDMLYSYDALKANHGDNTDDWPTDPEKWECASCCLNCKDRVNKFIYDEK